MIMTGGDFTASAMQVGWRNIGNFVQSGGIVNVTSSSGSSIYLTIGTLGNGSYTLSGTARLSATKEILAWGSPGTFTRSGGTNSTPELDCGYEGNGTYTLNSGLLSTVNEYISYAGNGTFVQTGGINLVSSQMIVQGFGSNTYTLSGGSLACSDEEVGIYGSPGCTGVFTQSGGTNTAGFLGLGFDVNTGAVKATYNLNGGLLQTAAMAEGTGPAGLNFTSGTLQATASFSDNLPIALATAGGTATIDTQGFTVSLSGSLSGSGNLAKTGIGKLNLTASNSYTGSTNVVGGTLYLAPPAPYLAE